ncbi:Opy1p [Saccharomyces eubayanus]|uniref:Opy1p n=1 Tax=Saccharomyces eubayanus TaxID=1080349 RepID=UPI0006C2298C|nr:OPY1-like protein [Saccharomyces eubayanus]KOH00448.1 OPY1-like protein [Saccharomyces eubayanus]
MLFNSKLVSRFIWSSCAGFILASLTIPMIAGQAAPSSQHEILIASNLIKKPSTSQNKTPIVQASPDNNDGKADDVTLSIQNYHHHHPHLWWPRSTDHHYWCVLRKNQFAYYKTQDEREAISVIPRFEILNFKISELDGILIVYTPSKDLMFKFPPGQNEQTDKELMHDWKIALEKFLSSPSGSESVTTGSDYDEDEDEDDLIVVDEKAGPSSRKHSCSLTMDEQLSHEDKKFYRMFDPRNPEHQVCSGILYTKVKKKKLFNRAKWQKFNVELTNISFSLYSFKTGKIKKSIKLNKIVDCIEIDNSSKNKSGDTNFALITFDERLSFKAANDQDMVDWIINFKSGILIRKKIKS